MNAPLRPPRLLLLTSAYFLLGELAQACKRLEVPHLLVDLGAKTCVPCRMMEPILVELEKDYKGKAAVVFIDVREDNASAKRFGIRAIPTQIFFDKAGKEVSRHEGFMDKKTIADRLNKLLAK